MKHTHTRLPCIYSLNLIHYHISYYCITIILVWPSSFYTIPFVLKIAPFQSRFKMSYESAEWGWHNLYPELSFVPHLNLCQCLKIGKFIPLYAPEIEDREAYCFCPVCHSVLNFNLAYNFWMVCTRALIFPMSVPYGKTFPWVPNFLTMWPWCLTYLQKTLTLAITFKWYVLGCWYFTWVFLVTRYFHGCQNFWPCDLDLDIWPTY
jgi:hypothetical protein